MTKQAQGKVGCLGMHKRSAPLGSHLLCRLPVWKTCSVFQSFKFSPLRSSVPGAPMMVLENCSTCPIVYRAA